MKGRNYEKVEKVGHRRWRGRRREVIGDCLAFSTVFSQGVEYRSVEMLLELRSRYEEHLIIVQVWLFVSFFGMVFHQARISWLLRRASTLVPCDVFIRFMSSSFFKNKPLSWSCLICFSSLLFITVVSILSFDCLPTPLIARWIRYYASQYVDH